MDDGLPPFLCETCVSVLTDFYNFTVIYEQSTEYLKNQVNQQDSVSDTKDISCDELLLEKQLEAIHSDVPPNQEKNADDNKQVDTINVQEITECVDQDNQEEYTSDESIKAELVEKLPEDYADTEGDTELSEFNNDDNSSPSIFPYSSQTIGAECSDMVIYEEISKYECKSCGDIYLHPSGMVNHLVKRHSLHDVDLNKYMVKGYVKARKPVKELCKDELIYPQESETTPQPPSVIKCQLCKKVFEDIDSLRNHQVVHKTYICEKCGASFIKKSYLEDHKEGHDTERRYKCKYCGKQFKRRTVLVKHKRIHTNPRECVCEICGKRFNDKGTLKTHNMLLHIKDRKFKCALCGLSFPLKPTLEKHIRRHIKRENGVKDFPCEQCDMKYKDKSSLMRHVLAKHTENSPRFTCEECGRQYTSPTNLYKHKRLHHNLANISEAVPTVEEQG